MGFSQQLVVCCKAPQSSSQSKMLVYYKCQHFPIDATCIDGGIAHFSAPFLTNNHITAAVITQVAVGDYLKALSEKL